MIKHILTLIWNKKGANSLVLIEIFLAFLVLVAVLSFCFFNIDRLSEPMGFETDNMKYIKYGDLDHLDSLQRSDAIKQLRRELQALELVESVAFSHDVSPYGGSNWCHGNDDNGYDVRACYSVVDFNFIETNGMKIIAGRDFREEDMMGTYPAIIPNKMFMEETFGEKSMLDSLIIWQGDESRIIGIVEAYKYDGEFKESENKMLALYAPKFDPYVRLTNAYLKLDQSADVAYEEKISKVVQSVLKTTSFVIQDAPLLRKRSNLETWIPIVALLSMCLFLCINVALGLFGVLSYAISKRKGEVGLRRAVGAHAGAITMQFILEIVLLAALAIGIGTFFAIQIPLLKVMDIEASVFYRGIIFSVVIILLVVTACALYPSIQASRIHPATALHED